MELLMVGFGGMLGSLTRFIVSEFISKKIKAEIPLATFIVNITGAVLLGIISGLSLPTNLVLFAAFGFMGAYTTFSTFAYEGLDLFYKSNRIKAFLYMIISIVLGAAGFIAGIEFSKLMS